MRISDWSSDVCSSDLASGSMAQACHASTTSKRGIMRILIVEDEPTLGRQLKSTLEQTGYAVDLTTNGEDGHFMGSTENYDAVILDLGLPEIDGLTVLGMWRKEGRDFPVLRSEEHTSELQSLMRNSYADF